jgi:N-acetylglucosamine kinase-like BadF-type ATPase
LNGGEYLLGLDTGMSKTVAALSDLTGRIVAEERGDGMTLHGAPTEDQLAILGDVVSRACAAAGIGRHELAHVAAGVSGVDFEKQWEAQHDAFCRGLGLEPATTSLVNDAVVALWGATKAERSMIVQQGSAYTSAYRTAAGLERVFDPFDYARLFDIRRESLARVVRMLDGRAPMSPFAARFLEHFGVRDLDGLNESLSHRSGDGWRRLSTIAGVVSASWREGDPAATEMLESLAADLVVTVRAMEGHLGRGPFEAAFGGGVLAHLGTAFLELMSARVASACPQAEVVAVTLAPERGALVMAGHHAGVAPAPLFDALAQQRERSRAATAPGIESGLSEGTPR